MTAEQIPPISPAAWDRATIAQAAAALRRGDASAEALTEACLARIAARDGALNAFIRVLQHEAREAARTADRELAAGTDRGLLHGIPISVKDLFDLTGTPTTAASQVRAEHVATADAGVVARLKAAGAVIVGKTNLHEFAFGTTNEDSAYGPVRHPLDENRSPGGSSGGAAASVLAGMAFGAVGTDTGGSIRIPAAACGLVGLKPTTREIPLDGVVPLSETLDHAGPLCRSVADAAALYSVMAGRPIPEERTRDVRGLRVGVLRDYFTTLLDAEVSRAFDIACEQLTTAGARLTTVSVPHAPDIGPVYLHLVLSEAAAFHAATLDSRPDAYTPNVRIRLEMGRYILAEDYVRAMRGREILTGEVDAALEDQDVLLLPALAIPAPKLGTTTVRLSGSDEPIRNVMLRLTQLFNITGHPALSLPCGKTMSGLPIGLQLVGRRGATPDLLQAAAAIEAQCAPGTPG